MVRFFHPVSKAESSRRFCLLLAVLLITSPHFTPAEAAIRRGAAQDDGRHGERSMVAAIQQRLAEIGLYLGAFDGDLSPETSAAIRRYQRESKLKVNGTPTKALLTHLKSAAYQAKRLRSQLEDARRNQSAKARKAIDDNQQARALLEQGRKSWAHSVPGCGELVTPACLIAEGHLVAQQIGKVDFRDWAYGRLAAAEAAIGDAAGALATAAIISDPRLIMATMGRVVEAHIRAGQVKQAVYTAGAIPNPRLSVAAYITIAKYHWNNDDNAAAKNMLDQAVKTASSISNDRQRARSQAGIASLIAKYGNHTKANNILATAEASAQATTSTTDRASAFGQVAQAQVRMGMIRQALVTLRTVGEDQSRTSTFVLAARALSDQGRIDEALDIAQSITEIRYRVGALSYIAIIQYIAGDSSGGAVTLHQAEEIAETISFGYAFGYALSRVAEAQSKTGHFKQARKTAQRIIDGVLRVRTLWSIARIMRTANATGALIAQEQTIALAGTIPGGLERVWVLCDLAESLSSENDKRAREIFAKALTAARGLGTDWYRARALARAAMALNILNNP